MIIIVALGLVIINGLFVGYCLFGDVYEKPKLKIKRILKKERK